MIRLRFTELLDEKRKRDGKPWSMRDITAETGVLKNTLIYWRRSGVKLLGGDTIIALCEFLECTIGELIVYVPDEQEPDAA